MATDIARRLGLLVALCCALPAHADFSNASLDAHPVFEVDRPFILELTGTWPDACTPAGLQPMVSAAADRIEISFDEPDAPGGCAAVLTPYRVLVDLAPVVLDQKLVFDPEVTVAFSFREQSREFELSAFCGVITPTPNRCRTDSHQAVDSGVYAAADLGKQGILFSRQDQVLGSYPLVYNANGDAHWLVGGGPIAYDTAFLELYESSGGQCLDCEPQGAAELTRVGRMSVLIDGPDTLQVKINNGLFTEYRNQVFGYPLLSFGVSGESEGQLVDLEGRWAITSVFEDPANGTEPPSDFLPLVFNLQYLGLPQIGTPPPGIPDSYAWTLHDLDGEAITEVYCSAGQVGAPCGMVDPGVDGRPYTLEFLSAERLLIRDAGPALGVGARSFAVAVRVD